jgi:hypothetical protein
MPCYQCGSPDGSTLQLCPACIEKNRLEKLQARRDILEYEPQGDLVHDLMRDPWLKATGVFQLVTALFVLLLFTGPVARYGIWASFLFASATAIGLVALLILIFLWIRMLMHDTMWAVVSLLFPGFIYRYVIVNWEQKEVKIFFFIQAFCTLLSLFLTQVLANHLGTHFLSVYFMLQDYLYGRASSISDMSEDFLPLPGMGQTGF